MRFEALVTDYDGTLAHHGTVADSTVAALERLKASGRRLVLVTGRLLPDVRDAFPRLDLFDRVVAENGALLYRPDTREEKLLAAAPPAAFVEALRRAGVSPLGVGRVIVATREPHEHTVLGIIHDLGLELQVIFNKGAVMILPATVNKATGLKAALDELTLSPHNAVGIGDAENDHAFLALCEASVAVANALPMVQEQADLVTSGAQGDGVDELIDRLLADDLASLTDRLGRHDILMGRLASGEDVRLRAFGPLLLVAGPSGSGKSTLVTGIVERLLENAYQVCLVDPEGDYQRLGDALVLGDATRAPALVEVLEALSKPDRSGVVNLVAVPVGDRPGFCQGLLPRLDELRAETGRPHWIVVDEAHHLLPADWRPAGQVLIRDLHSLVAVTVHPGMLSSALLQAMSQVAAIGADPGETMRPLEPAWQAKVPRDLPGALEPGLAARWRRGKPSVEVFRVEPSRTERLRHRRKYAAGELPADMSFWFRGPDGRLNLRAQNLQLFAQIGAGVDAGTWVHHLENGDYERWFGDVIKDDDLARVAAEARRARTEQDAPPEASRRAILDAIDERYTAPA